MKKFLRLAAKILIPLGLIVAALWAYNSGMFTTIEIQKQVIDKEELRIDELKSSEEGQAVLETWARTKHAEEKKAEAEAELEVLREKALELGLE
jgi:stringent starvation protein B